MLEGISCSCVGEDKSGYFVNDHCDELSKIKY